MDYLKKREEIKKDELKYLKNKNDEYKAKNSDAERRLERKFYLIFFLESSLFQKRRKQNRNAKREPRILEHRQSIFRFQIFQLWTSIPILIFLILWSTSRSRRQNSTFLLRKLLQKLKKLKGISHGFFNKEGGKSKGIYQSLNCGPGSNDKKKHIKQITKNIKNH